jgi:hypothetical protein
LQGLLRLDAEIHVLLGVKLLWRVAGGERFGADRETCQNAQQPN